MSDLLERVEKSIGSRGLLRRGQSVLVGVSGGVDSMVLLHLLHKLSGQHAWRLSVAHLNHRLRGRSSGADERLVVRAAKELGLPVIVERADVKKFARLEKISLEMAARKIRHEFLVRTAKRLNIRTVALAHHADDQLELFFLRLFRGSGSEGLAGMKWRNASPAAAHLQLVRPLLDQPKSGLSGFAVENKIRFREDASNASLDIQRNRIRHELLPLLRRKYQPALDRTISRVRDILGAEAEFVGQVAAVPDGSIPFEKRSVAIQRRQIQGQLLNHKVTPDFELVEQLRQHPGHLVKVSPDLAVVLEAGGRLLVQASRHIAAPNPAVCELDLQPVGGPAVFGGVKFEWQLASRRSQRLPKARPGREQFDAGKIGKRIRLRHWRAGDRFQPSGMRSPVKLQDLFVNGKIPQAERHSLIVAETMVGEIFWVERLRIAERFKLSDATNRCLQWHWKRL